MNPRLRATVTHRADQHLAQAADLIPRLGDDRFVTLTAQLAQLIQCCADHSKLGIDPDCVIRSEMTFRNLGLLALFAQVGVEQAALSGLAQAEADDLEGDVE